VFKSLTFFGGHFTYLRLTGYGKLPIVSLNVCIGLVLTRLSWPVDLTTFWYIPKLSFVPG